MEDWPLAKDQPIKNLMVIHMLQRQILVFIFVCLSRIMQRVMMDFDEILWTDWTLGKDQYTRFWWISGSGYDSIMNRLIYCSGKTIQLETSGHQLYVPRQLNGFR